MKPSNILFVLLLLVCFGLQPLVGQEIESQQLSPLNPTKGEGLGLATATDGNFIVATTLATRKLVVFERDRNHWLHLTSLKGINSQVDIPASKGFGKSVAIMGNRIAVGAPESVVGNKNDIGLVETFALIEGKWQFESVLRPPDPGASACFGKSLALGNNTLLVGAPAFNYEEGQAFIYENNNGNWSGVALETDLKPTAKFGSSVALRGENMALVGAPGVEIKRDQVGALFIYGRNYVGSWSLNQTIYGDSKLENLGQSMDISGNLLAVGAYDAVALYTLEGNEWVQNTIITNPDQGESFSFASTLQLSPNGQHLLVGASSKIYLFSYKTGEWVLLTTLSDETPLFGSYNSLGNDFFLINSPYSGTDYMNGILYLHPLNTYLDNALLK